MRLAVIAITALFLASCGGSAGSEFCYKTVRSPTGKGPRALAATPCAPEGQAMSINARDLDRATAG